MATLDPLPSAKKLCGRFDDGTVWLLLADGFVNRNALSWGSDVRVEAKKEKTAVS